MFAKKRSIVKLHNTLNPKYQFLFSLNNENYMIDVDSVITIDMNANQNIRDALLEARISMEFSKFRVTIHKLNNDGFRTFVNYKEFHHYDDVISFIQSWKDSQ